MPTDLSRSTRLLITCLLAFALLFQISFSITLLIGHSYAHNGRFALAERNWTDAAWFYRHANDWSPYDHNWWYSLAVAEHNLGNSEIAVNALENCLKRSPTFISGINRAAGIMIEVGLQPVASKLIEQAEVLVPNYWEPTYLKGLTAMTAGDWTSASDLFVLADQRSLNPHPRALGFLAQAAYESGRVELAGSAIDRAVAADSTIARHSMLAGNIHYAAGNLKKSQAAYERAARIYTAGSSETGTQSYEMATVYARLGQVYAEQHDTDRAVQAFYQAATLYADLVPQAKTISSLHTELLSELRAQSSAIQMQWACVLAAGQLWDLASPRFQAMDSSPEVWTPMARYSFAMTLRGIGRPNDALVQFQKLSSFDLISARGYAETLYEAGRPAAAGFEYAKILTSFSLTDQQRVEIQTRLDNLSQAQ